KSYTICGHRSTKRWLCRAFTRKEFHNKHGFRVTKITRKSTCSMRNKSRIEFGFCPDCVKARNH
ncbi:hypothetical protein QR685DRAFT_437269, partial [Neurospora intermedia]